jgi:hypothetical protein
VDPITFLTQAVLVLLAVLTAVDYALHRDGPHRDTALLFASLGGAVLVPAFARIGLPADPVRFTSVALILAEPYLWLRVVRHHRPVWPRMLWIALTAGLVAVTAFLTTPTPTSLGVTLFIVIYMAAIGIYGSAGG